MPEKTLEPCDPLPRQPTRLLLQRLGIFVASAAATCLLLEIGVRLSGYVPYYHNPSLFVPSEDAEMGYDLRPNFRGLFFGGRVTTNAHAVRVCGISGDSTCRRLAMLGDSVAFGHGVSDNQTIPCKLEGLLGRRAGHQWDVINLAVPGYDIEQVVRRYAHHRRRIRPDVVVYLFHPNDIWPNARLRSYMADDGTWRRTAWTFMNAHCDLFNIVVPGMSRLVNALSHGATAQVEATRAFYDSPKDLARLRTGFAALKKMTTEDDAKLLVVLFVSPVLTSPEDAASRQFLAEVSQKVDRILSGLHLAFLVPLDAFRHHDVRSLIVRRYDDHLSEEGARLLAAAIADALKQHGMLAPLSLAPQTRHANLSRQRLH